MIPGSYLAGSQNPFTVFLLIRLHVEASLETPRDYLSRVICYSGDAGLLKCKCNFISKVSCPLQISGGQQLKKNTCAKATCHPPESSSSLPLHILDPIFFSSPSPDRSRQWAPPPQRTVSKTERTSNQGLQTIFGGQQGSIRHTVGHPKACRDDASRGARFPGPPNVKPLSSPAYKWQTKSTCLLHGRPPPIVSYRCAV